MTDKERIAELTAHHDDLKANASNPDLDRLEALANAASPGPWSLWRQSARRL